MGEIVDFNEYEQVEVSPQLEISPHVIEMAADLLKTGRSRNSVKMKLAEMGYNINDAEKIVSKAEALLFSKPKKKINFPIIFFGFIVALAAIVFIAYFVMSFTTGAVDCQDDVFCVQKTIDCEDGKYTSTYRGLTNEYTITNRDTYCQVFVKVLDSSSFKFTPGMNMNCLYPIANTKSQIAPDYADCDGSLALAFRS